MHASAAQSVGVLHAGLNRYNLGACRRHRRSGSRTRNPRNSIPNRTRRK
ncbi:MAG: hypothetical protein ABW276_13640 [Casimicrobiaceae bacterium]